jgi:hypothetical protein
MSHTASVHTLPGPRGADPLFLTYSDLAAVRAFVKEIAPSWSAELNQASADESTIVVTPAAANDLLGPAFVLHRIEGRVKLDQFRWDEYRQLGAFATLHQALAAMAARLVPLVSPRPAAAGAAR